MSSSLKQQAQAIRASLRGVDASAHKQIALRRVRDAIMLADCNPQHSFSLLAEARFHAQFARKGL